MLIRYSLKSYITVINANFIKCFEIQTYFYFSYIYVYNLHIQIDYTLPTPYQTLKTYKHIKRGVTREFRLLFRHSFCRLEAVFLVFYGFTKQ